MKNKDLIVFFVIFLIATTASYIPIVSQHSIRPGTFYLMWSPGFAAITTCLIMRRNLKGFGWLPGKPIWLLAGYLMPVAYALVAYCFVWLTGLGGFPNPEFLQNAQKHFPQPTELMSVVMYLLNLMVITSIPNMLKPLGEELGWRGFRLPELAKKMSNARAALIIGVIWALWHYPAILCTDYNIGTPGWFAIPCFTAMVISASFITAWLRLRSKSVWPCVIWHSSHNCIIQAFFTPITIDRTYTKFFIDEFGITLVITITLAAFICWRSKPPEKIGTGTTAPDSASLAQ
jgi:membrane protease YdiL (CAAX protease family)